MSLPMLNMYHKKAYPAIYPTLPQLSQSGKTVVVSGGSTGIGFAIARSFVQAGASRVIILGRRSDFAEASAAALNQESGRDAAQGIALDAYKLYDINDFWARLHGAGVYVHVLVLSAASFGKRASILGSTLEDTWDQYEANVRSPLAMTLGFAKQTTGHEKKYLVNVSTIATYMWTTMAPNRPTYGPTKNAGSTLVQQIAKDTSPDEMQIVSFHPGIVFTESGKNEGLDENSFDWDHEDLPGNFSVWAACPEAAFLHGRFVWSNWDVEELKNGVVGNRIREDEHFLKFGVEGLTEKSGGVQITLEGGTLKM